jgi:hypothetical protein
MHVKATTRAPLSLAALALPLACAATARAQNFREVPIGGRTATMGGAGTAAGNDSAMPYLNPAGMAGLPGGVFAVSASVYGTTQRAITDFYAPTGFNPSLGPVVVQKNTVSSSSVTELPSSVMYFKYLSPADAPWKQVLGMALIIPDSPKLEIQGSFRASFPKEPLDLALDDTLTRTSTTYYVGPTWAAAYGDWLRVGLSAHLAYERDFVATSSNGSALLNRGIDSAQLAISSGASGYSISFAPTLGVQLRAAPKLWVGAAFRPPAIPITGSYNRTESSNIVATSDSGAPNNSIEQLTESGVYHYAPPMHVNVGLAWDDRENFSIAVDAHYYFKRSDLVHQAGLSRDQQTRSGEIGRDATTLAVFNSGSEGVLDFSLGAEYALNPLMAIRAGVFTDMAGAPSLDNQQPSDAYTLREDRYGVTAGLGVTAGAFDTTFGVVYARGVGKFVTGDLSALGGTNRAAIDATSNTVIFVLSGAVTTDEAKATIEKNSPIKLPDIIK